MKSNKSMLLTIAVVSLCVLFFLADTQAATIYNSVINFGTIKGTIEDDPTPDHVWQDDSLFVKIRYRRRGFYPNFFYEIDANFVVTPKKYDNIIVLLTHTMPDYETIKISAYYTDDTSEIIAWVSSGTTAIFSINSNKYLGYIKVSHNRWQKQKVNEYIYVDLLGAYQID